MHNMIANQKINNFNINNIKYIKKSSSKKYYFVFLFLLSICIIYFTYYAYGMITHKQSPKNNLLTTNILYEYYNNIYEKIIRLFTINNIIIKGNKEIKIEKIQNIVNKYNGKTIFDISIWDVKHDIEKEIQQIQSIEVELFFPNIINIKIKEKIAAAIWHNNDGKFIVIDKNGDQIADQNIDDDKINQIMIFGNDANKNFNKINILLNNYSFREKIASLYFVNNRRWNIFLNNGIIIKLPETHFLNAIQFMEYLLTNNDIRMVDYNNNIININDIKVFDMRLWPKKIYFS